MRWHKSEETEEEEEEEEIGGKEEGRKEVRMEIACHATPPPSPQPSRRHSYLVKGRASAQDIFNFSFDRPVHHTTCVTPPLGLEEENQSLFV